LRRNQIFRAALAAKTVNRDVMAAQGPTDATEFPVIADALAPKVIQVQLVVAVKTDAMDAKAQLAHRGLTETSARKAPLAQQARQVRLAQQARQVRLAQQARQAPQVLPVT
jgi:hypothetical protein